MKIIKELIWEFSLLALIIGMLSAVTIAIATFVYPHTFPQNYFNAIAITGLVVCGFPLIPKILEYLGFEIIFQKKGIKPEKKFIPQSHEEQQAERIRESGENHTLVTHAELLKRAYAEGVNILKICSMVPRWAESAPLKPGVKSALVKCDLILRSDGSIVALDGMMAMDSTVLYREHMKGESNPTNLPWDEFIKSVSNPEILD